MSLTTEQIENIQIDYGLVYLDYGETTEKQLGPTRGGGEFKATKTIRDIEFDGMLGKTKGMQVITEINANLQVSILDTSAAMLEFAMPQAELVTETGVIQNTTGGVIAATKYVKNVTMFAKLVGGGYKKISLFNAMSENDFTLKAAPKGEGVIPLEIHAHWDPTSMVAGSLYKIEDVASIE